MIPRYLNLFLALLKRLSVRQFPPRQLPGYSLLEVALVLLIMGALGMGILPLIVKIQDHRQEQRTLEHLEAIQNSLDEYYRTHDKTFPCPSCPDASEEAFGLAQDQCPAHDGSYIGIVPFRTLGLSGAIAKDGHGQWITYVRGKVQPVPLFPDAARMHPEFDAHYHISGAPSSGAMGFHQSRADDNGAPLDLYFLSPTGARISALDPRENKAIGYIVLSHGQNHQGAFTGRGRDRHPGKTSHPLLRDNSQDSNVFIEASRQNTPYFDHILRWKAVYSLG